MKTFADKAYDLLRKVPKGRITTYKEIAHALETRAYRGVGQAGDFKERHREPLYRKKYQIS